MFVFPFGVPWVERVVPDHFQALYWNSAIVFFLEPGTCIRRGPSPLLDYPARS